MAICPHDRQVLHERIAARFEVMMKQGFLAEVSQLRERGDLHFDLPAVRAVGYRQLWQHLEGECTLEEAVANAIAATRQLAKRQLTWLRKWPDLNWLLTERDGNLQARVRSDENSAQFSEQPLSLALNYLDKPPL